MTLSPEKYLPMAMIILSISAALVYFYGGDFRKGIYWTAAAVLNIAVTF